MLLQFTLTQQCKPHSPLTSSLNTINKLLHFISAICFASIYLHFNKQNKNQLHTLCTFTLFYIFLCRLNLLVATQTVVPSPHPTSRDLTHFRWPTIINTSIRLTATPSSLQIDSLLTASTVRSFALSTTVDIRPWSTFP